MLFFTSNTRPIHLTKSFTLDWKSDQSKSTWCAAIPCHAAYLCQFKRRTNQPSHLWNACAEYRCWANTSKQIPSQTKSSKVGATTLHIVVRSRSHLARASEKITLTLLGYPNIMRLYQWWLSYLKRLNFDGKMVYYNRHNNSHFSQNKDILCAVKSTLIAKKTLHIFLVKLNQPYCQKQRTMSHLRTPSMLAKRWAYLINLLPIFAPSTSNASILGFF